MKFVFLFSALFLLIALVGLVFMHEVVHVQIFEYYGVKSKAVFFPYSDSGNAAQVEIVGGSFRSEDTQNAAMLAHSVNEVVGYTIAPFLVLLSTLSFMRFLLLARLTVVSEARK